MVRSRKVKRETTPRDDECLLPDVVPLKTRQGFSLKSTDAQALPIREYVESQAHGEKVTFLQLLTTERVYGQDYALWDVRTDANRWWVVTRPTNLYRQDDFPNIDFLLSFHIGLMARVMARSEPAITDEEHQRLAPAWRRLSQAKDAQERANEAEDFQAVGMRSRECLLEFVRGVADESMVPIDGDAPKQGDFIHWSELIAETIAPGSRNAALRGYLKAIAMEAWRFNNWLTHARNAVRMDGRIAVDATEHVIATFAGALVRYETGMPDRCGICSSYRITREYRPDLHIDSPYVTTCESCGAVVPRRGSDSTEG
jgi:hypothetical protein